MTNFLLKQLQQSIENREPDLILGDPANPYMERWHIKREPAGSIYLHKISADDDDRALHDHPWDSTSIILQGILREHYYVRQMYAGIYPDFSERQDSRMLVAGQIYSRTAEDLHRLEVVDGPVWSLFITGPLRRKWGFLTKNGWTHWKDYDARMQENRKGDQLPSDEVL